MSGRGPSLVASAPATSVRTGPRPTVRTYPSAATSPVASAARTAPSGSSSTSRSSPSPNPRPDGRGPHERGSTGWREDQGEVLDRPDDAGVLERRLGFHRVLRDPAVPLPQRDAELEPSEVRPEAAMDPAA